MNFRKTALTFLIALLFGVPVLLSQSNSQGIDEKTNDSFMPFALAWENLIFTEVSIGGVGIPVVLILLMGGATLFTFYFLFVNIRYFITAIQVVRGKYDDLEGEVEKQEDISDTIKDETQDGEVNHF